MKGLIAVISVKVAEPQFEGQTKTKQLGNNEVSGAVNQAVGEALTYYLEEHPKEAKVIVDKVVLAATARIAARKAANPYSARARWAGGLPGKLADCSSRNPEECELFLVEGDSAGAQHLFRELRRQDDPPRVRISTNSLASTDAFIAYAISHKYKRRYLRDFGFAA